MGQEPAHNSKPEWQSWAGFSRGLFCQGLNWCTQMDPEGGHWSSISWQPWSGDLEPKGSSQTISRGQGRPWFSSSSAGHTEESPEWFWQWSSITWDQPSFIQCCCVPSVPAAASGPAPKVPNLGQAAVNEARVQRCCFVSRADLGEVQPQQLFQGRAGGKHQTLHYLRRDVLALLTQELIRRSHRMSWTERDPPGVPAPGPAQTP